MATVSEASPKRLLLSINEVAAAMSVRRTLVCKLIYDGTLPSLTIGRRRLIAFEDLQRFIEIRKVAG